MEFEQKRDRLVLTTIAQAGPSGLDSRTLFSNLSLFVTAESIQRSIENLFIKGDVVIVNTGGEVRYIASKTVRDSLLTLEIQKVRLVEYLKELSKKKDEILKIEDKSKQAEELRKLIGRGFVLIATGLLSLYEKRPETTIPEYIEALQPLVDVLEKLAKMVEIPYSKEELDNILKLIEKYRGEKDYQIMKDLIEHETAKNQ
ncbi:hypothetical protein SUSAZ_05930 [Sulfolobus acidocaldarius SUSAZ]|nr:hypothetical protein SUSAZ_05930 [Sulfolobus acidocaldarius SUSAZ]